ncbi:MAG: DUF3047 domain-containing protein, partial [Dehalococcoidia bacterium]|nr:DUF3047 domain-containing protein [Dehalococcoidia bacterium]
MTRRLLPLVLVVLLTPAWAADRVVIEDWKKPPLGAKGIPPDWKGQDWGSPAYDMTIEENDAHRILHLRSKDESSTVSKDIKGKVDLKQTPILEWSWKAVALPHGGDSRKKGLD